MQAQQGEQLPVPDSGGAALGAPVTVHGVVKNALSGEPLARALVQVDGGGGTGALTDGDGRFEIPGIGLGPNTFQITKPGYEDAGGMPAGAALRDMRGWSHNVFVVNETPELVFQLRPSNSIRGRVDLSTGDPANNLITLIRCDVVNGRSVWHPMGGTRVDSDGMYHFAHLQDGDYAVVAEPSPESDLVALPATGEPDRNNASNWYAQTYYPDARDFSGAARIHVSGGEQAQANFSLPLERFHAVRATLELPAAFRAGEKMPGAQFEITTLDGHHLPYPAAYKDNSITAMLPDGSYTMQGTVFAPQSDAIALRIAEATSHSGPVLRVRTGLTGQLDFTVAGRALGKLRVPVGPVTPTPIQLDVNRTSTKAARPGNHGEVFVEISPAGPLADGMQSMFAQGSGPGAIETNPPSPGRYWVHTIVADSTLCEGSFVAGAANLGREPLVVGQSGVTSQLTLTLRDDCASLTLSLPANASGLAAGEEPAYTVYVVPDFDFTTEAPSRTLRASTGPTATLNNLTPGSYRIYVFSAPVDLEYHNRESLAGFPSQSVTLAPGDTQSITLEVPAQ
ncbi:MAG TPA: carboxypeptidase regulatory-like domain-containing protein [Terracidiphilus sp.]